MSRHYGFGQNILWRSNDRRWYARKSRRERANVKHVIQIDVEPTIVMNDFARYEPCMVGTNTEKR